MAADLQLLVGDHLSTDQTRRMASPGRSDHAAANSAPNPHYPAIRKANKKRGAAVLSQIRQKQPWPARSSYEIRANYAGFVHPVRLLQLRRAIVAGKTHLHTGELPCGGNPSPLLEGFLPHLPEIHQPCRIRSQTTSFAASFAAGENPTTPPYFHGCPITVASVSHASQPPWPSTAKPSINHGRSPARTMHAIAGPEDLMSRSFSRGFRLGTGCGSQAMDPGSKPR
ncbi:hypothetical protein ACLOJK_003624 [Asimina triloba]